MQEDNLENLKVNEKEIKMAEQLISSMTTKWDPNKYHDEYRNVFLQFIEEKIQAGEDKMINQDKPLEEIGPIKEKSNETIDLMSLLKKSLKNNEGSDTPTAAYSKSKKQRIRKANR